MKKGLKDIKIGLIKVQFPKSLELEFYESYIKTSLPQIRFSLICSSFIFGIFSLLDYLLLPNYFRFFFILRIGIFVPFAFLCFGLSFIVFKKLLK